MPSRRLTSAINPPPFARIQPIRLRDAQVAFTLCRSRFVELYGLATIVGAGIDTYWLPEISSPVQVFMAIRLVAPEDELGEDKPHQLAVRVLGPDMQPVGDELTMEFAAPANPMKRPGWEGGIIMRVVHVFPADETGVYTIELAVDGRGHSTSIIVEQGSPPT